MTSAAPQSVSGNVAHGLRIGWAGNPPRWQGASGGVPTVLAAHPVDTGAAAFALHLRAEPGRPVRSTRTIDESAAAGARSAVR